MFSKAQLKKALMTLILLIMAISMIMGTLVGCEKFTRAPEKDPAKQGQDEDTIKVELKEVSCLKDTPKLLQAFLDDEGDAKSLETGIGCIQDSLKAFAKHTRGEKSDSYSGKEIQNFFNKYLLKENNISDNFQHEIMKLKTIVVGGTTDTITRVELEQFHQFLGELKSVGEKLHGKLKLLFFRKKQSEVSYQDVADVQKAVQEVASQILDRSKITTSRYQWVDLISFFTELNAFVGDSKGLREALKWVPLAESVKVLFIGENAKLLTEQEWRASVKWTIDTYAVILKFFYTIRGSEFKSADEWPVLTIWLDEVLKGIEASPVMKEKKLLDAKAIDRLAEEIYDLKLFKTVLSLELIKSSYRKVLVHIFDRLPGGAGDPQNISGLNERHLRIFKREYNIWKIGQMFLNDVYRTHKDVTIPVLVEATKKFDFKSKIKEMTQEPLEQREYEQAWIDYAMSFAWEKPLLFDSENKLVLAYTKNLVKNSFSGMSLHNFIRTITRLLVFGYGEKNSGALFRNNVSEKGLMQLEEDFREFGQRIGFLDPRTENPAARTFKEANWFTADGNGDGWMTPRETMQELAALISGGQSVAGQIMADLENSKCETGDKDPFDKPIMKEACFVQALRANFFKYFGNMQWMVADFAKINKDDNQFTAFYQSIMAVARLKPEFHKPGQIEYAEIRTVTTILHYVETLVIVYDKNGNQKLDETELSAAVPRFASFIEQSLKERGQSSDNIEDIFLYLLYNGQEPTGYSDMIPFIAKRKVWGLGEVDKLNILKVLGAFKK